MKISDCNSKYLDCLAVLQKNILGGFFGSNCRNYWYFDYRKALVKAAMKILVTTVKNASTEPTLELSSNWMSVFSG